MSGRIIGPADKDQALRLISEGKTLAEAAHIIGRSYSGLHRALTETWPDEYADAKQRRDDLIRNRVWQLGMGDEATQDAPTMRWALDHLVKWHLPEGKTADGAEGANDGIAEAIDRFTALVGTLAARSLQDAPAELADRGALNSGRETEG